MKTYSYIGSPSDIAMVLQLPELQNRRITQISYQKRFDDFGRDLGEQINITVADEPVSQQVIEPTSEERLEAAELMIDLLLDTQESI